ncbi:hypothetical protein A2160_05385 [Candidatus Beckwithbacteria bacterium RBG_13_42_9]|uniref:Uncharacterized protein n=1 Tax=Candidatus Beckwithbacteria bacterium RBG_13_42_9 TaxID=1797457 RepID=A0A1F5E6P5_9BACT|nr:MAG: hypothetical protein A2160_05385 [Candidatus Beckwithbacteria bacterium RBG_13_42_9]
MVEIIALGDGFEARHSVASTGEHITILQTPVGASVVIGEGDMQRGITAKAGQSGVEMNGFGDSPVARATIVAELEAACGIQVEPRTAATVGYSQRFSIAWEAFEARRTDRPL